MIQEVDDFIANSDRWKDELSALRNIVLECGLTESFKWKQPCYMCNGKNILIISSFKEYAFISFFKGALLADTSTILEKPGENSNAGRLIKFKSANDIGTIRKTLKAYIFEAVEVEKLGLDVKSKSVDDFEMPEELLLKFEESSKLQKAFEALTPGRRKGYLLYFTQAKQSATRTSRIEKYTDRILMGKGMRDCICGHSKRMPACDGSHKHIL